jgi:prevent-host-death family protein
MISKAQLKSQLLEQLRRVEKEKKPLIVTHRGKPVVQIVPYHEDPLQMLQALRGSVIAYREPTQPVEEVW